MGRRGGEVRAWGLFENQRRVSQTVLWGCGHLLGSHHHPWHMGVGEGSEMCQGIVFPWALPLTSPPWSRSSRSGQTHLRFHPLVSVDTRTRVSLEASPCLWFGLVPQPSRLHPFPVPFYLQSRSSVPLCGSCACISPHLKGGSPCAPT